MSKGNHTFLFEQDSALVLHLKTQNIEARAFNNKIQSRFMYVPSTIDFLSDSGNADSEDKRGERDPAVISPMVGLSDGSQTTIFAVSDAQTLNIQLRGCAC